MRRRLLTTLTATSLLLCLAAMAFWLRSIWAEDQLLFTGPGSHYWRLVSSGQRQGSSFVFTTGNGWPAWGQAPLYSSAKIWAHLPSEFCYYVDQPADTRLRTRLLTWERSMGALAFGPDNAAWSYAWGAAGRGPANLVPRYVRVPYLCIAIPHWIAALLFALLPLTRLAHYLRRWNRERQHLRSGHCRHCGYDLRATPDRCPECGTPSRPLPAEGARRR